MLCPFVYIQCMRVRCYNIPLLKARYSLLHLIGCIYAFHSHFLQNRTLSNRHVIYIPQLFQDVCIVNNLQIWPKIDDDDITFLASNVSAPPAAATSGQFQPLDLLAVERARSRTHSDIDNSDSMLISKPAKLCIMHWLIIAYPYAI